MKDFRSSSLRSLLTETAPILVLPPRVLQQLVGYYGDWRRSRDILNEAADESPSAERRHPGSPRAGTFRINRSSLWRW
jgi:hypothetical protein